MKSSGKSVLAEKEGKTGMDTPFNKPEKAKDSVCQEQNIAGRTLAMQGGGELDTWWKEVGSSDNM